MQARKCDRCGTYYEAYIGIKEEKTNTNGLILISRNINDYSRYMEVTSYDLCPCCMSLLTNFLKKKENGLK